MDKSAKRAVVLLSGGLDSTVTAAFAKKQGYQCLSLAFDYGQRHRIELRRSQAVAQRLGFEHQMIYLDLRSAGGSALTSDLSVPKTITGEPEGREDAIPSTYVPARNLVFLSIAAAFAEARGAGDIFIGVNRVDYSGYPDCRPEFISAFERALQLGTKAGTQGRAIRVQTPIVNLTKAEIVLLGRDLAAPMELTWTCYDPTLSQRPCGQCDACLYRQKGFLEAGFADPALTLTDVDDALS